MKRVIQLFSQSVAGRRRLCHAVARVSLVVSAVIVAGCGGGASTEGSSLISSLMPSSLMSSTSTAPSAAANSSSGASVSTTSAIAPCASKPVTWTIGNNSCAGTALSTPSGASTVVLNDSPQVAGAATLSCVNGSWVAPTNLTCGASAPQGAIETRRIDAARLLGQATFGPTMAEIDRVASIGSEAWLADQFQRAPMDSHWDYVMVRKGPIGCTVCNSNYINAAMESFWTQAVRGSDQLRQRTVFALSQLFVVSAINSSIEASEDAHSSYLDMLSRNAFGNFRTLLEQVSTHPAMAHYLSHMQNLKEDSATGRLPDENFAREVMQLFTIGLWQLNEDGSRRKNAAGADIPTFTQADVMGMAKVFTGWSWGGGDKSTGHFNGWSGVDWKSQLQNYPQFHSTSEKRFLGTVVPAGSSGEQAMSMAMDALFNHPNVGPFVGAQLIKRLVTSNPSPAYIARVTRAFNDNGAGVRGDMRAVLRAVLMDSEARDLSKMSDPVWGKLREPMIRFSSWMRAFDAKAANGYYAIWNLEDTVSSIGQNPLRAPSVFNWYRPSYSPPGEIMRRGLVAPEFQITNETTATGYVNFVVNVVDDGYGVGAGTITSTYSAELAMANNPVALIDRLNLLLVAGQMSLSTRDTILSAVNAIPASNTRGRVATAVALVMISPDFIVQK